MGQILNFFNNIYNKPRSLALFIFAFSVICSLIFMVFLVNIGPVEHQVPGTDYTTRYEPIANSLLQGEGLTIEGEVYPNRPPGYPIYLVGIFTLSRLTGIERLDLIVVFNVILMALAAYLLFLVAREIFNKKIALIASLLWASYPLSLWFVKNPNTEVLFIPLLYAGILFYILTLKRKDFKFALLAGIALGLASLVRPIGLFLPFFLSFLMIIFFWKVQSKKRQVFLAMILLAGSLLVVSPWMVYLDSKTGDFTSFSLTISHSVVTGITWLVEPGQQVVLSNDVSALIERVKAEDLTSLSNLSRFFGQELVNSPLTLLKLAGLKIARSWYATSSGWYEKEILVVQLLYLLFSFFGLIYLISKNKINKATLLLCVVFYFVAITFISVSILRYMIPAMGLMIVFSAVTVNILINKLWHPLSQ